MAIRSRQLQIVSVLIVTIGLIVLLVAASTRARHTLPGPLGNLIPIVDGVENRVFVVDGNRNPPVLALHLFKAGTGAGEFHQPSDAAIDPQGRIWVTDTMNHRIQIFDHSGRVVRVIGAGEDPSVQFDQPSGIAIAPSGRVFVADAATQRVTELDTNGKLMASWPTAGNGSSQIVSPLHVAVDSALGRIYVIDILARVQLFDQKGRHIGNWGAVGFGSGQLRWPQLAVGHNGSLYVTDESLQRVTKFDRNGTPLKSWGVHGINAGQFYIPRDVIHDEQNRVWVFDSGNRRLQVFDNDGRFLFEWGQRIFAPDTHGTLQLPHGLGFGFGLLSSISLIALGWEVLSRRSQIRAGPIRA